MADNDWELSPQYGIPGKVSPQAAVTLSNLLRQSVPTGEEGDTRSALQRFGDAYADLAPSLSNALLRYGDRVLVPAAKDIPGAMLDALTTAGDLSLAYGPPNLGPAGPAAMALGTLLKAPGAAVARLVGRAPDNAPAALEGLQREVTGLIDAGRNLGVRPGPMPDVPMSAQDQISRLTTVRDQMKPRIEAKQAALDATNAAAPKSSVPNVDGMAPIRERNAVMDTLQGNPFVQPIPGRQGFPTKQAQIDLAQKFFESGGRLSPGGPWGRDMQEEIRSILSSAARKADNVSFGPAANRPGAEDAVRAYRDVSNSAAAKDRFLDFRRRQVEGLKRRLKDSGSDQ